jgi:hypothetical protein
VDTVFVPCLNELRGSAEFFECEAVLLMDDCSPHMADEVVALLTSLRIRIITFTPHMTHIFQVLDVVLFGAMKKHDTDLTNLDETLSAAAFLIKVYHDFKQTMIEVNIWEPLQLSDSLTTSRRLRINYSSMRKSSDKVGASSSYGTAICPWRVCRRAGDKQSLDGSTNQDKSISSIVQIFFMSTNQDIQPTIELKKCSFPCTHRLYYIYCMLFDIIIAIHISSSLTVFHSVA